MRRTLYMLLAFAVGMLLVGLLGDSLLMLRATIQHREILADGSGDIWVMLFVCGAGSWLTMLAMRGGDAYGKEADDAAERKREAKKAKARVSKEDIVSKDVVSLAQFKSHKTKDSI